MFRWIISLKNDAFPENMTYHYEFSFKKSSFLVNSVLLAGQHL